MLRFYIEDEKFKPYQESFESKKEKTNEDIIEFNKRVEVYNQYQANYSQAFDIVESKRVEDLNNWNKTVSSFFNNNYK